MNFKEDEMIFVLGAGISADAGIPVSSKMIEEVEIMIRENNEWSFFRDLYYLIKSGVSYSYGLKGEKFGFNIEVLMNILNELEKKEAHPLYPFIGSWNIKFNEIVKDNFTIITVFKKKIYEQLKKWLSPEDHSKSAYLNKFADFQKKFQQPIKIFSLNYDSLLEINLKRLKIVTGFNNEDKKWNYKLFSEQPEPPNIYLYKLHGSINWKREPNIGEVKCIDSIPDEPDLIFGTQYKMQYVEPYLFLVSEFRYYCFRAKLIVTLGYSFNDEHINGIISQALQYDSSKKLYALAFKENECTIKQKLNNTNNNLKIINDKTAKDFFENDFKLDTFRNLFQNNTNENDIF